MAAIPGRKGPQAPVAVNRKAYRNFEIVEKFEAGLVLVGSEVKSLRTSAADLEGAYGRVSGGECWLVGAKIAPYRQASMAAHEPVRKRKLLLHAAQIKKITTRLEQRGFTLVPLRLFFNSRGLAKAEIALARGKRLYDKRQKITERTQKRQLERESKKYRHRKRG